MSARFTTLLLSFLLAAPLVRAGEAAYEAQYAHLLATYVRAGLVDYAGLVASSNSLEECRRSFAAVSEREFSGWTVPQRLAYLINYYNLTVLKIASDDYPLSSIRKAGGWFSGSPFEWNAVELFGHRITLNILLRNYIRRDYAEPGVHLALCQGARGSPPLRSEPYTGEQLYAQLEDQARLFLERPPHNRIDRERKRMHLSPVFRWYADEFIRKAGSVEAYIRIISPEQWGIRDMPGRFSVSYSDFDWRLNDAAPRRK